MLTQALEGGFDNPPVHSAHAFRGIMTAMAMPGTIHSVTGARPPAPVSAAAGTALLTLCDADTPIHLGASLDTEALRQWIAFHIGAPLVGPSQCAFAVGRWADLSLEAFPIGSPDYPDRSATLIVETDTLAPRGATLTGPGIRDTARLSLPETDAFARNRALFPLGLDFIFTCGDHLAALPRTTEVR